MEFAYLVRPAFDGEFLARANEAERAVFGQHAEWLQARYAEGRVRFAGRCDDGPFGLVVLDVEDEHEARRLMAADPSVRAGVQSAELYPFTTFLARGQRPDG